MATRDIPTIQVRHGRLDATHVGTATHVRVPSDKSLTHRALILGALADGPSRIEGWLAAGDTRATLRCVRALGLRVEQQNGTLTIDGRGPGTLQAPATPLNCANAGTGMRLLAGILAGQPFASTLDGSAQLRRRPMKRIIDPLRQMGAAITDCGGHAPLRFRPARLHGITYSLPVASAQVKSCILLAGLHADSPTTIIEPGPARDHTERLLRAMGAEVQIDGPHITLTPGARLTPLNLVIPGDISSAAFVIAAVLLAGVHDVTLTGVGVNPTRTGILDILAAMGADVTLRQQRDECGEPVADLQIAPTALCGASIGGDLIVRAIDEFPALMVAATQAEGTTEVREAAELRVKETDRIAIMAAELRKLGAAITELPDGFRVTGPQRLRGTTVQGHEDHRVAMALAVAGLIAEGDTVIEDAACVNDSFPRFVETLAGLGGTIAWGSNEDTMKGGTDD